MNRHRSVSPARAGLENMLKSADTSVLVAFWLFGTILEIMTENDSHSHIFPIQVSSTMSSTSSFSRLPRTLSAHPSQKVSSSSLM